MGKSNVNISETRMMDRIKYFGGILLVLMGVFTFCSFMFLASVHNDICDLENTTFISGEKLTYKIFYNWSFIWVPAGEVYFTLSETDSTYVADIIGKSYPSYDTVFKVDDRYQSIIDKSTLLPKQFVRDIKQGKYFRYDSLVFDQKGLAVSEFYGKSEEKAKWSRFDLNNCTQDLISILYHLRNRDISNISKGDKLPVSFFFSKKLYELDIDIVDIRNKKIKDLGKYNVIHTRPELITGSVFSEDSVMDVWVSHDENKLPLLIESPVVVGKVKAVLKAHKNLKFPLEEY